MRYGFESLDDQQLAMANVVFVVGTHAIFNNMVIDKLRKSCEYTDNSDNNLGEYLEEFGIANTEENITISNVVDIDSFFNVVAIPSVLGRWYCSVDLDTLNSKQVSKVEAYMKHSNSNGMLVVTSMQFKSYVKYMKIKQFDFDKAVHMVSLSFPKNRDLQKIVRAMFLDNGCSIDKKSIDLFIMRMSNSYDKYNDVVTGICSRFTGRQIGEPVEKKEEDSLADDLYELAEKLTIEEKEEKREEKEEEIVEQNEIICISYKEFKQQMRGIENYVLDDLMLRLVKPLKDDNISGRTKIDKVVNLLVEEYGARAVVNKLRYKVRDCIEYRVAINNGIIPIGVRFDVDKAKKQLGEGSNIAKHSNYMFVKNAQLASKTSLRDWMFMHMILLSARDKFNEYSYERILYTLVSRSVLNESRLLNDIGISNISELDNTYDKLIMGTHE